MTTTADPGAPLVPDDLVLSHFSLGRFLPFEERVRAANDAGFRGIGFYVGDYQRLRHEGRTDADLRSILDDAGLRLVEIEALRGWSADGHGRSSYRALEDAVFALNDALGPAETVQVIGPFDGDLDDAAAAFAGVCDRAAAHGLAAAIEFLPEMSNIPDAATAMDIVRRAGRDNGGLCVDVWHHYRGANDEAMLRAIPPGRIFTVQFNDGPRRRVDTDYYTDCTRFRLPPGEGDFDLVRFLQLLDGMGVRRPLSVEVLSSALQQQPPGAVARRLASQTRKVVTTARVSNLQRAET